MPNESKNWKASSCRDPGYPGDIEEPGHRNCYTLRTWSSSIPNSIIELHDRDTYPQSRGPYWTVATHAREHFNAVSNIFLVLKHEIKVAVKLLVIRITQILENHCHICMFSPIDPREDQQRHFVRETIVTSKNDLMKFIVSGNFASCRQACHTAK